MSGTVPPNPGNQCWPQSPPFIVADQVGLQQRTEFEPWLDFTTHVLAVAGQQETGAIADGSQQGLDAFGNGRVDGLDGFGWREAAEVEVGDAAVAPDLLRLGGQLLASPPGICFPSS